MIATNLDWRMSNSVFALNKIELTSTHSNNWIKTNTVEVITGRRSTKWEARERWNKNIQIKCKSIQILFLCANAISSPIYFKWRNEIAQFQFAARNVENCRCQNAFESQCILSNCRTINSVLLGNAPTITTPFPLEIESNRKFKWQKWLPIYRNPPKRDEFVKITNFGVCSEVFSSFFLFI